MSTTMVPSPTEQPTQTIEPSTFTPTIQIIPTRLNTEGLREVPCKFERCETDDLIELIASMLDRLIAHNDRIPLTSDSLTRFHSRSPPSITIKDYLKRIHRYTNVEPICFLSILPYIDRICEKLASFTICSLTVHRFCITAVTVGSKSICDSFHANSRYAKVGGIGLGEMNLLERELLIAIDYRLITTGEVLNRYYLSLVQSHPTYTLLPPNSDPSATSSTTSTARHSTISAYHPEPIHLEPSDPQSITLRLPDDDDGSDECKSGQEKEVEKVEEPKQPSPDCIHDEEMG